MSDTAEDVRQKLLGVERCPNCSEDCEPGTIHPSKYNDFLLICPWCNSKTTANGIISVAARAT